MKKRNDFPDFVPENDDFAYQDGHPDDPQGDDPDEYDPNCADDDDPVEVAGQADMFAHEDFWNASADDSEALPEEEKVYKHSIFKPEMNRLAAQASLLAQERLTAMGQKTVVVPLGSAIGLTLLAGAGPGIAVQILPVGSVQAAFSTDFTTAGINQTRHRISLVLTANVQIVIPTGAKNVQASTQMAMAESIIVGQVPDSFAEGGSDNSIIDLAP